MGDAVAGVCECWDHRRHGLGVVRDRVINEIEKAKRNGVKLQRLAIQMEKLVATDEGWTIEDAKMLKEVFSLYSISFVVKV